jgi:SHS2 domain-containing protein
MRMEKFVFLEHTADAKFQAFGQTLEEAFENAALAVVSLMWDSESISLRKKMSIVVSGQDLKQLLMAFLGEILYLLDTEMFLLGRVERTSIQKKEDRFLLSSCFNGDSYSEKYHVFGEVKAITYFDMYIVV